MEESFQLPVFFNGEEIDFPSLLYRYGFTHRIDVTIHRNKITFEPDEERNYRAIASPEEYEKMKKAVDPALLKAVIQAIESLVK